MSIEIQFNPDQMRRFIQADEFLAHAWQNRRDKRPEAYVSNLEAYFNTYVLGDSVATQLYSQMR